MEEAAAARTLLLGWLVAGVACFFLLLMSLDLSIIAFFIAFACINCCTALFFSFIYCIYIMHVDYYGFWLPELI
jgi:hypothetical protein